jgi:hypothetical protein
MFQIGRIQMIAFNASNFAMWEPRVTSTPLRRLPQSPSECVAELARLLCVGEVEAEALYRIAAGLAHLVRSARPRLAGATLAAPRRHIQLEAPEPTAPLRNVDLVRENAVQLGRCSLAGSVRHGVM